VQKHSLLKPFQIRKSSQFSTNSTSQTPDTNYTKTMKDKIKQENKIKINKIKSSLRRKFLFLSKSHLQGLQDDKSPSKHASKQAKTKSTIIVPRPVFPNPA
jgi:hypothetical protein